MIDIIIPAYNAHKTINQTLLSIAMQDNIKDINVFLINDASNRDYSEQVTIFSNFMKIKELKLKQNKGPGYARQYGIDHSKSEYIIFIDSDDMFFAYNSVKTLYETIKSDNYDVVVSSFTEEHDQGYNKISNNIIFMHGKIYRRDCLNTLNIRFNDSYENEDNGFNNLLFLHNIKVKYIDDITYIWRNNKESMTRKNNHEYLYSGLNGYIYNIYWALINAFNDNCDINKIISLAYSCLVSVYFYYLEFKNDELIYSIKKIYNIIKEYPLEKEVKERLYKSQYEYSINDRNYLMIINPFITFNDFIDRVEKYGSSDEL